MLPRPDRPHDQLLSCDDDSQRRPLWERSAVPPPVMCCGWSPSRSPATTRRWAGGVRWCCCCRCCWESCAAIVGLAAAPARKQLWAAFAFGLPILPVVLTLAVLADVYACRSLPAGCPTGCSARLSSRPARRIALASKQNSISRRRSRCVASCCQVPPLIDAVLDRTRRSRSAAPAAGRSVSRVARRRPGLGPGEDRRPAAWRPDPSWRAIRRWCCSSYSHARRCATRRITNSVSTRGSRPRSSRPP